MKILVSDLYLLKFQMKRVYLQIMFEMFKKKKVFDTKFRSCRNLYLTFGRHYQREIEKSNVTRVILLLNFTIT